MEITSETGSTSYRPTATLRSHRTSRVHAEGQGVPGVGKGGRAGGAGAGQEGIMRSCPDSTFLASGRLVNILCSDWPILGVLSQ